jgi:prepilin-type N-terminal cleavage/methylation domain-containing protein
MKAGNALTPLHHLKSEKGFTLLELLMVLSIIAMLSIVLLPMLTGHLNSVSLRIFAEEVANEIRLAQMIARSSGRNTTLTFFSSSVPGVSRIEMTYHGDSFSNRIKEPLYLPEGISFERRADSQISFTSLGGVHHFGLPGMGAFTTILLCDRSGEKYYVVIAAVNSGRVRVSPVP